MRAILNGAGSEAGDAGRVGAAGTAHYAAGFAAPARDAARAGGHEQPRCEWDVLPMPLPVSFGEFLLTAPNQHARRVFMELVVAALTAAANDAEEAVAMQVGPRGVTRRAGCSCMCVPCGRCAVCAWFALCVHL